ncbi:MAG TPA: ATPase, T2SS/T4P/T4SS family [Candidatus Ratteibacteria bacterium]|mgnify:CR=1 FL=1|uniref:Type II secretion system protein E n=1 Tax=candidate division TA06 bacterium ADurb.Bin131 TaxID=1852827 RepID=A0A1V6CDL4_UNCT6|nr:MAG: Type II secretion system protein E [candidate division TA06 bacterium ADurb.Bin131]HON04935.1 ATPase, T2SS/T4P/T4SS family [bacterium]HPC28775.1 ATPase, T2SS/T4P/T4SS family [bacterium]HRS05663.1 ATPase, T2SS/T4P/T4SS family [Candidatus Ratteibacteria bacterium]HRV03536.1 ATPase, T2SS/T4P/T4SS family [Candidatus Ratteibacteria bacterium]
MAERKLLGEMLIEAGLITEKELDEALKEQAKSGGFLGRILVEKGYVSEKDLKKILSTQSGIEMIDLKNTPIDKNAISAFPSALAKTYNVLPIKLDKNLLTLAVGDTLSLNIQDDISFILGYKIKMVLADEEDIKENINVYYGSEMETIDDLIKWISQDMSEMEELETLASGHGEYATITSLEEIASLPPVVKLFDLILLQTVRDNASDVHLEPFEKDFRVRYRVDGVLYDMVHPPKGLSFALFCRFKIMASMDIAERRLPQDGRIELSVMGRPVDLRVNTVPTVFGECLAIRVLDRGKTIFDMENLGLLKEEMDIVENLIHRPHGIILATGPTGCGKTTTLYALLRKLNTPEVKLITTEDPVEYMLDGAVQVPVKESIGLTFAACIRSILRQDPDIILVGEIRDFDTAQMAIQSSLTGHLVLSTLHTNDAPTTIMRLVDMKVEPFLLASTIGGIIAQRLVRVLCSRCKEEYRPTKQEIIELGISDEVAEQMKFYKPVGCPFCRGGYKGRVAIFEILIPNENLWRCVLEKKPLGEIREIATGECGMKTLVQDGIEKINLGITSIEEIIREVHGYG